MTIVDIALGVIDTLDFDSLLPVLTFSRLETTNHGSWQGRARAQTSHCLTVHKDSWKAAIYASNHIVPM